MSGARSKGGRDFQAEKTARGELGVPLCQVVIEGICVLG